MRSIRKMYALWTNCDSCYQLDFGFNLTVVLTSVFGALGSQDASGWFFKHLHACIFFYFTIKTYSSAKCAVCILLLSDVFRKLQNLFFVFHFLLEFILKRLPLFSSLVDIFIDFSQFRFSSLVLLQKGNCQLQQPDFLHLSTALLKWHNDKFWLNDSRGNRSAAHCESKQKRIQFILFDYVA